jgi:hypothetical protein
VIVPYEGLYTGATQWAIADFLGLTVAQRNVMWGCVDHELHHFTEDTNERINQTRCRTAYAPCGR